MSDIKKIYNTLMSNGVYAGRDPEQLDSVMRANPESKKWVEAKMKELEQPTKEGSATPSQTTTTAPKAQSTSTPKVQSTPTPKPQPTTQSAPPKTTINTTQQTAPSAPRANNEQPQNVTPSASNVSATPATNTTQPTTATTNVADANATDYSKTWLGTDGPSVENPTKGLPTIGEMVDVANQTNTIAQPTASQNADGGSAEKAMTKDSQGSYRDVLGETKSDNGWKYRSSDKVKREYDLGVGDNTVESQIVQWAEKAPSTEDPNEPLYLTSLLNRDFNNESIEFLKKHNPELYKNFSNKQKWKAEDKKTSEYVGAMVDANLDYFKQFFPEGWSDDHIKAYIYDTKIFGKYDNHLLHYVKNDDYHAVGKYITSGILDIKRRFGENTHRYFMTHDNEQSDFLLNVALWAEKEYGFAKKTNIPEEFKQMLMRTLDEVTKADKDGATLMDKYDEVEDEDGNKIKVSRGEMFIEKALGKLDAYIQILEDIPNEDALKEELSADWVSNIFTNPWDAQQGLDEVAKAYKYRVAQANIASNEQAIEDLGELQKELKKEMGKYREADEFFSTSNLGDFANGGSVDELSKLGSNLAIAKEANKQSPEYFSLKQKLDKINYAKQLREEAQQMWEDGKTDGIFTGLWEGVRSGAKDPDLWTRGLASIENGHLISEILERYDPDDPKKGNLSKEEELVLDAFLYKLSVEASIDQGISYDVGKSLPESIAFMIEFLISPARGVARALSTKFAKWALKRYGKKLLKKNALKFATAKASITLGGHTLNAAIIPVTSGGVKTLSNVANRTNNKFDINKGVVEKGKSLPTAIIEGWYDSFTENWPEVAGGAILSKMLSPVTKGLKNAGLLPKSSKTWNTFKAKTGWHGTPIEFAEEIMTDLLKMPITDFEISTDERKGIFGARKMVTTFFSCLAIGTIMNVPNAVTYISESSRIKRNVEQSNALGGSVFSREKWDGIKSRIDNASAGEIEGVVMSEMMNGKLNTTQKKAILRYAGAKVQQDALLTRENELQMEAKASKVIDAQGTLNDKTKEGYNATDENEQRRMAILAQQSEQEVKAMLGGNEPEEMSALNTRYGVTTAEDLVAKVVNDESLTPEQRNAILNYINTDASKHAIEKRMADDANAQIMQAKREIDSYVNEDAVQARNPSNVITAKLKEDDSQVYIISGEMNELEDGTVDTKGSSKSIVVFNPNAEDPTKQKVMTTPAQLYDVTKGNAQAMLDERVSQIKAEHQRKLTQVTTGERTFEINQQITIPTQDGQGVQTATITNITPGKNGSPLITYTSDVDGTTSQVTIPKAEVEQKMDEVLLIGNTPSASETPSAITAEPQISVPQAPVVEVEETKPIEVEDNVTFEVDGNQMQGVVASIEEGDGVAIVQTEDNKVHRVPLDNLTIVEETATMEQGDNNVEPTTDATSEGSSQGMLDNSNEEEQNAPIAPTESTPQAETPSESAPQGANDSKLPPLMGIPTDENGNKMYESASVEATINDIYNDPELDEEEADAYVQARIDGATQRIADLEAKKPKMGESKEAYIAERATWREELATQQASLDYWQGVQEARKNSTSSAESAEITPIETSEESVAPIVEGTKDAQEEPSDNQDEKRSTKKKNPRLEESKADTEENAVKTLEEVYRKGDESNKERAKTAVLKALQDNISMESVDATLSNIRGRKRRIGWRKRQTSGEARAEYRALKFLEKAYESRSRELHAMDRFGKALGVTVQVVDQVDGGKANAKIVGNKVLIAKDAQKGVKVAFAHEMLHRIKALSDEAYEEFAQAIEKVFASPIELANGRKTLTFEQMMVNMRMRYSSHRMDISIDGVREEVVADLASMVMTNAKLMERFVEETEGKEWYWQIWNTIKEVFKAIKGVFQGADARAYENAEKVLLDAMKVASQKYTDTYGVREEEFLANKNESKDFVENHSPNAESKEYLDNFAEELKTIENERRNQEVAEIERRPIDGIGERSSSVLSREQTDNNRGNERIEERHKRTDGGRSDSNDIASQTPSEETEIQPRDGRIQRARIEGNTREERVKNAVQSGLFDGQLQAYGLTHTLEDVAPNGVGIYVDHNGEPSLYLASNTEANPSYVAVFKDKSGQWTSKMENSTGSKEFFKGMISDVMNALPEGAELIEHTSASVDGLRTLANQLKHGFVATGETYTCGLNAADIGGVLGIRDNGDFNSISWRHDEVEQLRDILEPYLVALGMPRESVDTRKNPRAKGEVEITLPVLKKNYPQIIPDHQTNSANEKFSIIGKRGASALDQVEEATIRMDNLEMARKMERFDYPTKSIRMATGWERGADGKWRYEIEDDFVFDIDGNVDYGKRNPQLLNDYKRYKELLHKKNALAFEGKQLDAEEQVEFDDLAVIWKGTKLHNSTRLKDYIDHPELFEAYPELRDVSISFDNVNARGEYNSSANEITLSNTLSPNEAKSTLIHEIQHAIQKIEGFARGGNVEASKNLIRERNNKALIWSFQKNISHMAKDNPGLSPLELIDKVLARRVELTGDNIATLEEQGAIPNEDGRIKAYNLWARGYDNEGYENAYNMVLGDDAFEVYRRHAGEVESRNVQSRMGMTPEQRRATLLAETEDVARKDQIFLMENSGVSAMAEDAKYSLRSNTPFYSNAEYAVENIKQGKATPEQWLAMIQKNGGLKAGEDKWLGLSEWLNEKGKRKDGRGKSVALTKEEVLEFINQNKIKIEEVGYSQFGEGFIDEATKKLEAELKEVGWDEMENRYPGFGEYFEMYGNELVWSEEKAGIGEYEDFILDNKILTPDAQDNAINETRERYTTEGLENKKEIALVVPSVDPYNAHDEIHFGDAGGGRAVAWVRFGETTDEDGNRVLVIDEIQSKRHQDGREKGYRDADVPNRVEDARKAVAEAEREFADFRNAMQEKYDYDSLVQGSAEERKEGRKAWRGKFTPEEMIKYDQLHDATIDARNALEEARQSQSRVPDAPFEKNWHELAMKRMLRYAAENGFDKVAWTTGAQQAERYSMGRLFNDIEREDNPNLEGRRFVLSGANAETFQVDDNGNITASTISEAEGKSLQEVVGKEMAIKMMNLEDGDLIENEDLRIGGEGMKGFYDKMLPSFMNKYGKKWGVKVGETTMPNIGDGGLTMHSVDVTDAMKESVMEGQPMFSLRSDVDARKVATDAVITSLEGSGIEVVRVSDAEVESLLGIGAEKSFADTKEEFRRRAELAEKNIGIVARGLNDAEIEIVDVSRHDFTGSGKDALRKAFDWAMRNIAKTHTYHEGQKDEFKYEIDYDAIDKFLSSSSTTNSENLGVHLAVLKQLPNVIDKSIDAEIHPDYKKINKVRSPKNGIDDENLLIHRLYGAVRIDDNIYRVKTTIYEFWDKENKAYDYRISKVELIVSGSPTSNAPTNPTFITGAKLLNGVEKSYDKDKKLLDESINNPEFHIVYHGSGAKFDAFDHSHMGEGEGAQAYGWGTYVTEVEDVGKTYANVGDYHYEQLKAHVRMYDGYLRDASEMLDEAIAKGDEKEIAKTKQTIVELEQRRAEMQEEMNSINPTRHLYTIEIPDDNGSNYLNHDKAVPSKEIARVKQRLFDILSQGDYKGVERELKEELNGVFAPGLEGDILYNNVSAYLGGDKYASQFFNEMGYVGIKYPTNYMSGGNTKGQSNYVIFNETDAKIVDRVEFLKTPQGEVYGWTDGKKVYLTEKGMNPETPIHEYTHIWSRAMKEKNAKGWQSVKDLLRDTPIWNEVMNDANYADIREDEDAVASEALSRISGKENAERMMQEAQKMIDGAKGIFEKANAVSLVDRMRRALREFWSWVGKNLFDIKSFGSIEEVTDRVLYDLVNNTELGVNEGAIESQVVEGEEGAKYSLRSDDGLSNPDKVIAREAYERMVASGRYQFTEAMQDSMMGLKLLYKAILGKKMQVENIPDFENAYIAENLMSSQNAAMQQEYYIKFMKPLVKAINALGGKDKAKRQAIIDYMMAKHGLERNLQMAHRDAKALADEAVYGIQFNTESEKQDTWQKAYDKAYKENREVDYAGLTALTGTDKVAEAEAKATEMVEQFETDNNKDNAVTELWARVNDATKANLNRLRNGGVISNQQYNDTLDMYEYYIPLRGWDATTSDEVYAYLTSKNTGMQGSTMKGAKGRKSKADDPIATIGAMADSAIREANRNAMKQRFLNFVLNHPSDLVSVDSIWLQYDDVTNTWIPVFADIKAEDTPDVVEQKIQEFNEKMEQLRRENPDKYKHGKEAQNIPYVVKPGMEKEHQVMVKRNGQTYILTINGNPRAAQALNGLTNPDVDVEGVIGKLLKSAEWVNRQLSAFYTTRNPDFVVSNFARDMIYSNVMAIVKEPIGYSMRFHANCGVALSMLPKLIYKWERGTLDMSNNLENMFYQFMINGGETGYTEIRDVEKHKRMIASELKKHKNVAKNAWHGLGAMYDGWNRSVENIARFAAFKTSREMGRTVQRSAYDAKEISVNFNKKGSGAKMLDAIGQTALGNFGAWLSGSGRLLWVFWNAGVQGATNFGKNVKRHPGMSLSMMTLMYALGVLLPMANDGDDEEKYYLLPEYVRRSNICFRVDDVWVTIPLPIEFRAMYGLGELYTAVTSGNEKLSDEELALAIAGQVSQTLPLDMLEGGGGLNAVIPSSVKPFIEAYRNVSWSGSPIHRDFYTIEEGKYNPQWTLAYPSTSSFLMNLTKTLNEWGGGDNNLPTKGEWWADWNPAKIEYILKGMFGGLYSTANKLYKTVETIRGKRKFESKNIPLWNRVVKDDDPEAMTRKINNAYYDAIDWSAEFEDKYKKTKKLSKGSVEYASKLDELMKSDEYKKFVYVNGYKEAISLIRKRLNYEGVEISAEELNERILALKKEMVEGMDTFNKKTTKEIEKENVGRELGIDESFKDVDKRKQAISDSIKIEEKKASGASGKELKEAQNRAKGRQKAIDTKLEKRRKEYTEGKKKDD